MKIGYWYLLIDDGIPPVELGRALEERGFESLFLGEHTNLPVHSGVPGREHDVIDLHQLTLAINGSDFQYRPVRRSLG